MKLLIISHTEHYLQDGNIVGWGPTITEINLLADVFEEIFHLAVLQEGAPPPSALPYTKNNIKFFPMSPFGGDVLRDKLGIIIKAPKVIKMVQNILRQADVFQFRAPTGIGVYLIP